MLFKILHGDASRISTNITPYHEGYCYVTHNGDFYVDMNDERVKLNAKDAETIMGASLANVLNNNPLEISTSQAVFSAIEAAKDDLNTNLNSRIDDIENDIATTNQNLSGVSQELENYKTTNDNAVSANTTGIANNKSAIEEIQGDYLTSTDKEELQDNILEVSEKATANASAIEVLNGEGAGSVKQSIDNAFNEFAANITNDDVVNTYKELIDYAATHNSEFVTLIGEVDTISKHIGEVEDDISSYKTEVSEQFTETDTIINGHVTNTNNPHGITKEQIGLGNVENTSDVEKPISYAMQEALDEKANTEHTHDASDITDGTLGVGYGGTGYYTIVDNTYTVARYRASALVSTEATPYDNGVINWLYE